MGERGYTTAEVGEAVSFGTGKGVVTLTIWTERRMAARGGLTKGRNAGMLVADTVPELLRLTANLFEQEGDWDGIVRKIGEAHGG